MPNCSATLSARSTVTQHMTFEYTWCLGAWRASQMPWSGSCQRLATASTMLDMTCCSKSDRCPRRSATDSMSIATGPNTSSWTWFEAALLMRTGRAPA